MRVGYLRGLLPAHDFFVSDLEGLIGEELGLEEPKA